LDVAIAKGATRTVLLIGNVAIKVPRLFSWAACWRNFLLGLIANMQEAEWGRTGYPEFCPVLFSIPGGFMVVMRRADPLTQEQYDAIDFEAFAKKPDYYVFVEPKIENMGLLDGRVVAVDYGN